MTLSPIKPKKEILTTSRLVLRPLENEDISNIVSLLLSEDVKKTYMLPDFATQRDAETFFLKLQTISQSKGRYFYGISFNGLCVGFINEVEIDDGCIEVGYVIHPDYHNRGIATEALGAMIAELFRIGFCRIKCGYFQGNDASRRVMEKNGMKKIDYEDDLQYRSILRHCLYYTIENA